LQFSGKISLHLGNGTRQANMVAVSLIGNQINQCHVSVTLSDIESRTWWDQFFRLCMRTLVPFDQQQSISV